MRKFTGQRLYLLVVILVTGLIVGYAALFHDRLDGPSAQAGPRKMGLEEIPFDGRQAFAYLQDICRIGTRVSGSKGMLAQQEMLIKHFEALGGKVELQAFKVRHPLDGSSVNMANLLVRWHPERPNRVLLCAHYDTRPFPDEDPVDPRGIFLGANDGGSGTALLMELGRHMPALNGKLGVDFALFDGEELVYDQRGEYFLGSTEFARQYASKPDGVKYRWAVLLDMVADADLRIFQEINSVRWPESKPLVDKLWGTARRLGVREFVARPRHEIRDDHLPLRNIGRIPACDVIDFDYPAWHTRDDTPERCAPLSLAKVGWVVHEWLKTAVN